eukprot:gene9076-biopygen630
MEGKQQRKWGARRSGGSRCGGSRSGRSGGSVVGVGSSDGSNSGSTGSDPAVAVFQSVSKPETRDASNYLSSRSHAC